MGGQDHLLGHCMKSATTPRVTLIQGTALGQARLPSGTANYRWTYFGQDEQRFQAIRQLPGAKERLILPGTLINQIAQEIRAEVVNVDARLVIESELLWQSSDLAERNPYTTQFFFHCCASIAFDRLLRELDRDLIVFTEDWFLTGWFAQHARDLGFAVHHRRVWPVPQLIARVLYQIGLMWQAVWKRGLFVGEYWRRKLLVGIGRHSARRPDATTDVMLVTWADPTTFPSARIKTDDTYYGRLPGLLRAQGRHISYLANAAWWKFPFREIINAIKSSPEHVITLEECVGWLDIPAAALLTLLQRWHLRSRFIIAGLDLSPLLEDALARERASWRPAQTLLYLCVPRYLARHGLRPTTLIHPFENHSWEKVLRNGCRRYLPDTIVIGYLHAPFAPLWLAYYPSKRDLYANQIPDRIVTLGSRWMTYLAEHGYPVDRLSSGPALRFEYLTSGAALRRTRPTGATILMAASIGTADSYMLLHKTIEALSNVPTVRVLLKFHPKMNGTPYQLLQTVLGSLGYERLPKHMEVIDRPVAELLLEVDLVLHNGTSVAGESLASGVPTLLVQSDLWFDMDVAALLQEHGSVARTPTEIRHTVEQLLAPSAQVAPNAQASPPIFLTSAFGPIDQAAVDRFLKSDQSVDV